MVMRFELTNCDNIAVTLRNADSDSCRKSRVAVANPGFLSQIQGASALSDRARRNGDLAEDRGCDGTAMSATGARLGLVGVTFVLLNHRAR